MMSENFNGGFVPKTVNTQDFCHPESEWDAIERGGCDEAAIYYFRRRELGGDLYYHTPTTGNIYYGEGLVGYEPMVRASKPRKASPDAKSGGPAAGSTGRGPLNVIHIGPHLQHGGAEQWLVDLASAVDPDVMQISYHVALSGDGINVGYVTQLAEANISVEVGGARSIKSAVRDADVVFCWGVSLDHYMATGPRPLTIQVVHGDGPCNRKFLEESRKSVDHFVAVSHRVQKRVCYDVPSTVIYNGIDIRRLARSQGSTTTRSQLGFAPDDFVVAFCGRMATEKRVDCIIEAVASLPPHVKLLAIGTGYREGYLRYIAEQLMPGRSVFTLADGNLGDLYSAADAFCLASSQEGCSLALLEAMLCGLPVISTPVGCAAEIIEHKVTGLLFDGSVKDLSRSIGMLADNEAWRQGLASNGQRLAERFGHSTRMARDYQQLVHSLVGSNSHE